MNTKDGYAKKSLTSARLLTADGGDTDNYLPLTGGTMTGALVTTALSVSGAATFSQAINGSILGNAATASRLQNARTISLTGRVTGSASFDGSSNISIDSTVARARFGDSSNEEHNCNNITMNGMWYYSSNGPSNLGEQSTDGALYSQAYSTSWVGQIAQDYRDGRLYVRSRNNGTWKKWYAVALSGEEFDLRNSVTFNPITQLFYFDGGGYITSKKYYRNCIVRFKAPTGTPFIRVQLTNTPGITQPIGGFKFVKNSTTAYAQTVNADSVSFTYSNTDYFSLEAINGTLYFYQNSTLIHSCTYTPNNFKVYIYGNGSDAFTLPEVSVTPLPITQFSGGGSITLSGLTDVQISSPSNGQVLKYNGSKWVNGTDNTSSGGSSSVTLPNSDITLSTTAQTYITADGVTRKIKLPSSNPWGSNVSIATSWIDSSAVRGVVSPTLTGDRPQVYIPEKKYVAFPVMQDSDGNLWVALPMDITALCNLDEWKQA